jgi:hypothetical protein
VCFVVVRSAASLRHSDRRASRGGASLSRGVQRLPSALRGLGGQQGPLAQEVGGWGRRRGREQQASGPVGARLGQICNVLQILLVESLLSSI